MIRTMMAEHAVEILLVEDDPGDTELTLRALRRYNVANHIEVVADGAEALDFLFRRGAYAARDAQTVPRVVLLDLKLPKINGLQVLRQVKADAHIRSIPVVVMTSSREDRDLEQAYQLGVNSYIVKPIDFEQFTEVVRQLGLYWLLLNEHPGASLRSGSYD
jgi:two-component system, response regulator